MRETTDLHSDFIDHVGGASRVGDEVGHPRYEGGFFSHKEQTGD
jgi:hypothetical protein